MAFQSYSSTEAVASMTTRQLRKYISEKGTEAQKRLDTMDISEQSQALKDSIHYITKGSNTRVYRGTSNLSKSEMREMADQIRIFNRLDTESHYAQEQEYDTNKARYESFIQNRVKAKDSYWKQFVQDGNVTKEGYAEYKKYINLIKEISDVSQYYSYKTILTKATKQLATGQEVNKRLQEMSKMLNDIFQDAENKGMTPKQLTEKFYQQWFDYEEENKLQHTIKSTDIKGKPEKYKPKGKKSVPSSKRGKQKSSSNVKTKTVGKLRDNAKVHR